MELRGTGNAPRASGAAARRRTCSRTLLSILLALAAALLLVPGAQAGLKFPPPQTLSPEGTAPMVAVDSQDRATVAWSGHGIQSVRLGADGIPGDVTTLAQVTEDFFFGPQVAVDPQGRATVVWGRDATRSNSGCGPFAPVSPTCVQAVHIDAQGNPGEVNTLAFGTPAHDPDFGDPSTDGPQVAVDSQGRATVVWRLASGSVQSVRLSPDGTPGEVKALSASFTGTGLGDPKLAIDSRDRVTVVWARGGIESVRLGADGSPGPVKTVSKRGQSGGFPEVAVDPRGRATVVWRRTDRGQRRIQAARVGTDGRPGAVKTLAKTRDLNPQVAVDRRGRATVLWLDMKPVVTRVQSRRLGADGHPGRIKTLTKARGAYTPQVAVDRRRRATVVWSRTPLRGNRMIDRIEARRLSPGGDPGPVQTLSRGEGLNYPQVAVDSQGRPTVVWWVSGGGIQSTRGESR